jgi:hypothetical protein
MRIEFNYFEKKNDYLKSMELLDDLHELKWKGKY